MIDGLTLLAFVPAALALNLTPGADMMFCLAQGLRHGPAPAAAASAGISTGAFIHAGAAGLGLSALVAAHPWAFDAIRWVGVAYLLWLAVAGWRAGTLTPATPLGQPGAGLLRAFASGLAVNLTNPKVILFVLAFLPQFVDPARPVLPQFLILGAIIAVGGFVVNAAVGYFAGGLGRRIAADPYLGRVLARISAAVFAVLALRLAWGAFASRA
jgi:threonine/homoserine/homoserine lactone efflux protein